MSATDPTVTDPVDGGSSVPALPPGPTTADDSAAADRSAAHGQPRRPRPRWAVWRSPEDQPRWSRPALLVVAAFAATLYAWHLSTSGYAPYYSMAVRSMSESWKAFFYGAADPGATITIDKLAGSFAPQALSARIFGFHQWSVTLPQVIEGVIAVLVMHRVVRRWAGPRAAIIAAAVFALTPVCASMFGHPMEDGALTMCLVLAVDAYQRAVLEGRLRSLLLAGFWVGVGFQCKMLQAWIILPALFIGYLVSAPVRLRRRLLHLVTAGVVTVAVSASWMVMMMLTPAQDRPYIDGSTNNSAFAMVVGYNGLGRFGIHVPGAIAAMGSGGGGGPSTNAEQGAPTGQNPAGQNSAGQNSAGQNSAGQTTGQTSGADGRTGATSQPPTGQNGQGLPDAGSTGQADGGAGRPELVTFGGGGPGGKSGVAKLFSETYAAQIGWLYPLAFLSLVVGLARWRKKGRTDRKAGGYLVWGLWLVTTFAVFTRIDIPHTAYLATLAPAIAALCATGITDLWQLYRDRTRVWGLLPLAIAGETAWTAYLLRDESGFLPWLEPLVIAAAAVAVLVLVAARVTRRVRRRFAVAGVLAGIGAMLLAPGAWATSVFDSRYAGSAFDAGAGPTGGIMGGGGGTGARGGGNSPAFFQELRDRSGRDAANGAFPGGGFKGSGAAPGGFFPTGGASGGAGSGGMGGGPAGMSGSDTLTAEQARLLAYVEAHDSGARYTMATVGWNEASTYILATGAAVMPMGGFSGSVPSPTLDRVRELIRTGQLRFFLLGGGGVGGMGRGGTGTTTAITTWVEANCTAVPASTYGGTSAADSGADTGGPVGFGGAGTSSLYECSASKA